MTNIHHNQINFIISPHPMRAISTFIILLIISGMHAQNNYTQYVNPMIGTGGHGHTFPGVTMPFAMVQLSPDTRIDGSWDGCSGYHYSDSIIYGFSHTHLSGTGCSDYGDIAFMPTFVSKPVEPIQKIDTLYYTFSHKNEIAKAGYYSVKLDNGIKVELTSTTRVGLQQYTYSKAGYAWITLNLKHRDELLEGKITEINKHSFSGLRRSKAWAENQLVYYYFEVSRDADQIIISKNEKGETKINLGYWVKVGEKILVKTALSSADEAGAKNNLTTELPHWNFEKVKKDANSAWNLELNRIKSYGGTKDEKVNFYTALYHCMIHPNIMNDVDGRYRGRDKQIHKAEGFNYYTVFSLWDTHRALHPLLNIIDKKRSHDFIMTFKAQFEQSGRLPMWELWGNETNCMIGFHSVSVILDAYNKGVISLEELKAIYPAVKAEAMSNRFGLDKFREKGYLSIEDESESVSKTLEYSYDFYCVSEIAKALSESKDEDYFNQLSQGWQNVYDFKSGFVRPRKNGGWLEPFDPKQVNNHFTEANAWQYSFAFPQDYEVVRNDLRIAQLFNADPRTTGREQSDITGLVGQYAQGNEPSHHIPYLFSTIDSSSKYVKKICNELYKPTPDGLCGNEDCGQMSAWYVFSAMGFYPVNPTSTNFEFGWMMFDSVKLLNGNSSATVYKNGFPYDQAYTQSDWFKLTGKNSNYYYSYCKNEDLSDRLLKQYMSAPIIASNSKDIISTTLKLKLTTNVDSINFNRYFKSPMDGIYYTIDGQEPSLNSRRFGRDSILIIDKNTTIKAIHIVNGGKHFSAVSTAHFYKRPNNYTIKINSTYNKQYTADGEEGLLDGLTGDTDWRKGRWQGYQSQDFEAIVDLKEVKSISKISTGFLQDTRSWILMPQKVIYYGSVDGINFEEIKTIDNEVADSNYNVQRKEFASASLTNQYRYIKVKALNYGQLPAWHQGAGGDAFIFVDEITIE
ncbi:MAG: GH92 family glycosyl hydrolase [bacterium]|nr:GH92 family glycosyl hydrolase [bacterium]